MRAAYAASVQPQRIKYHYLWIEALCMGISSSHSAWRTAMLSGCFAAHTATTVSSVQSRTHNQGDQGSAWFIAN